MGGGAGTWRTRRGWRLTTSTCPGPPPTPGPRDGGCVTRDRGSQADGGMDHLSAQLGNYSQRFNLIREHKTKNANHCGSKTDFSAVLFGVVWFKSTLNGLL